MMRADHAGSIDGADRDRDPADGLPAEDAAPPDLRHVVDRWARAVAEARVLEQRLQGIADTLPTAEERAIAIVEAALDALGASTGMAARLTADGCTLELVGAAHVPQEVSEMLRTLPLDAPLPLAEAARSGRPCYLESREELLARFPAAREFADRLGVQALAAVPVRDLARTQGAVAFGFAAPRQFTAGEKAMLRTLGSRYARALRTSRRYYAEHDARAAEAAARRTAEEARAVAEAGTRAQGDFVAVVSHELRTPLQAILGYADLLRMGVGGTLSPVHHDYVGRIAAGGTALLHVVENLLGFSAAQVHRQRIDVEAFDVRDTLTEVVELAEPLAHHKGLALRVEAPDGPIPATTDRHKVRQIATNLVGNAIKFTARGEVVVRLEVPAPARVRLAVRDTGAGIATSELPHLFEPFWQGGANAHASAGGTGLGLSIVRQLARLLGGDVTVHSEVGVGSTFTVDLASVVAAPERSAADG